MSYSGDLKSGQVLISNGRKEVGLQMVQISNGIWNPKAQPFEIWTYGHHFVKTIEILTKLFGFERSGFQMVGTTAMAIAKARPLENWTISNLTIKKSEF